MIDKVTVFAVLQEYDDGRPSKVWTIGDLTTEGKITAFVKEGGWYALTDTPSDWQKQNGMSKGWNWVFQLREKI